MITHIIKADCGCEFVTSSMGQVFNWCPLHKAAPQMFGLLKKLVNDGYNASIIRGAKEIIQKALAEAEGK